MISKNELKYYSSLLKKKFRELEGKFIVEGKKIVSEGLKGNFECEIIIVTDEFFENEKSFLDSAGSKIRIEVVSNIEFHRLKDTVTPQGIAAVFNKPQSAKNKIDSPSGGIICCLDDISDPGNLGTIIRNCDWFGITDILLTEKCAELYNPKVIRSSMGSLFHVNLLEGVRPASLEKFKSMGYRILCSDLNGENIYNYEAGNKIIIVFSNEANGPSREILNLADAKLTIPSFGQAESLNVASASAVILSWLVK